MKEYNYHPTHFLIQVTVTSLFTGLIALFSLYQILFGANKALFTFVMILALYNTFNSFVSISNPQKIYFGEGKLIFSAYGREQVYQIDEIKQIQMRYVSGNQRLYVSLNGGSLFKGRYWIRLSEFDHKEELEDLFAELEYKVDPESLIVIARRDGRKRLKKQTQ